MSQVSLNPIRHAVQTRSQLARLRILRGHMELLLKVILVMLLITANCFEA